MSRIAIVSILIFVFSGVILAGCTSNSPPGPVTSTPTPIPSATQAQPGNPAVSIVSPQNSAALPAGNVTVTVSVNNFDIVDKQGQVNVAGQGHLHYYLDVSPMPSDPAKPAIPPDAHAVWAHVASTSYTFTNVTPGSHIVSVQLANNDHTPVIPLATASAMIVVTPPGQPAATGGSSTASGGATVPVTLNAQNIAFDKNTISVPAGSTVVMTFNNLDSGIPHNFALYTDSSATQRLFAGDFVTGPKTVTYTFTAPSKSGNYFFRCDVHPTVMTGTFVVT
jgi:plastocyanin